MLKKFFTNDTSLKIISLLIAFAAWLIVVENMDRESYTTFRDVPIDMSNVEDSISTLGLNSITPDIEVANVNVGGVMYAVGNLVKEDIEIVPDVSKVTGAGVYELPLVGSIKGDRGEVMVSSVSPSRITVRFDTLHSKVLDIESNMNGIKSEAGYLIRDEVINPAQVSLTGPEAEVSRVAKCEIRTTVDEKLSETYSKKSNIILLDKNGNVVEQGNIRMDVTEATVTIPVMKIREVPVELQYLNVPKNFPLEKLNFNISNESISIAGLEASVDRYSTVLMDYIDFKELGIDSTFALPVVLQTGFINVENIQSVQVSLDSTNLASRTIDLENIKIINAPLGYKAEALAQQLTAVELIGDKAVLETITVEDIVAEVDMKQSSEVEAGQVLMPVKIYVPNGSLVWAKGSYEVVVAIEVDAK